MSINRNNYEEFFMLYADGELSPADRQAVDRFVMENPDLAPELDLYHQLQLPAEDVSFAHKNSLYRTEAEDISAANHEEKFLLYVDNELNDTAKEKVERFVLQNPVYQESFTLLKQTKLPVETIVFPDKASLYRKEEKRPVLYMRWTRMAAAAAFIGLAVLVWTLLPHDDNTAGTKVLASAPKSTARPETQVHSPENIQQPNSSAATGENSSDELAQTPVKTVTGNDKNDGSVNSITPFKTGNDIAEKQPEIIAQATVPVIEEKQQAVTMGITQRNTIPPAGTGGITVLPEDTHTIHEASTNDEQAVVAQHAVYKELDTDDEQKSLYLGSIEINKDKLRGFFRKAGSLFRSKSKQMEDDNTDATPATRRTLK